MGWEFAAPAFRVTRVQAKRGFLRSGAIGFALFLWLSAIAAPASAETLTCTKAEQTTANKALKLSAAKAAESVARNLPFGEARSDDTRNEQILVQNDYVIGFDTALKVPLWVAYELTSRKLGKAPRINCFRADPRLVAKLRSDPSDYNEPIFDQGHLAPNGDLTGSKTSVINSFVMTNMAPQYCQFNRGVWQILESLVRHWAEEDEVLYVMSGSIFDRDGNGRRDPDDAAEHMKSKNGKARVAVPSAFYKVIVRRNVGGGFESITLLLPHDQTDLDGDAAVQYLAAHVSDIGTVEKLAGIDIFPDAQQEPTESSALWPTGNFVGESLVFAPCRKTAGADVN
jgi:endonuclease G